MEHIKTFAEKDDGDSYTDSLSCEEKGNESVCKQRHTTSTDGNGNNMSMRKIITEEIVEL